LAKQTDPVFISGIIFIRICLGCHEIIPITHKPQAATTACGFFCGPGGIFALQRKPP
jgi:hypothetical protein